MKHSTVVLLALAMALLAVRPKFTGFEANINRMITAYKIFIEDVERGFSRMTFYFDNLDSYSTNEEMFTVTFTDGLNFTIENLEDSKAAIYDSLETLLSEVYYIYNRRSRYHTQMVGGYDEVVQFIATMDIEDLDQTLRDLFKQFLVKKNLFFYDVTNLKSFIENSVVNIVNAYDMLETFVHDTMRVGDVYQKLTVKQVKGFYFIAGFLSQLREYYQNHNELLEEINKAFLSLENTLNEVDSYLESLKFYYYRRYVEGYSEDQINNFPQELFSENVESETGNEGDSKAVEDERDPIDVCDQVLLSNFGIRGRTTAFEVDPFEKLGHCSTIKNSCCDQSELTDLYESYYDINFSMLNRKQGLVAGILNKILGNYELVRDLGYYFLKSPASSQVCRDVARKIAFTPLSKEFVDKFKVYMANAQEFASRSRAAALCMVCDYDFHKTIQEERKVKLTREFCSMMMGNYFDYVSVLNLQLVDYFNAVVDLVQCDKDSGNMNRETIMAFAADERINGILAGCESSREYCPEFCQEFKFTNLDSALDVDIVTLRRFYNFLETKFKENNTEMVGSVDSDLFSSAGAKYSLERNDLPSKSLDGIVRQFMEDLNDQTAHNPFAEGTSLLRFIRKEQDAEE